MIQDVAHHKTEWVIRKFSGDRDQYEAWLRGEAQPYEEVVIDGNLLLTEGIAEMFLLLCTTGGTKWDNTNAHIGVGDSATAEAIGQTGLQAATNKLWKAMEASYPTLSGGNVFTWRSVFGSAEANFDWNEFTISNAADDTGDNLNRKVSAQGTKASGQTWTVDLRITWS